VQAFWERSSVLIRLKLIVKHDLRTEYHRETPSGQNRVSIVPRETRSFAVSQKIAT
jgi:hypothetical protein